MQRNRSLLTILLFCFAAPFAAGQQPLHAHIALTQTTVRNDKNFSVSVVVRNTGSKEQSLTVWSCSYADQWASDNPAIQVNIVACLKNSPYKLKLKPNESYERQVQLHVHLSRGQIARQKVTFRLGYGKDPYFGTRDFAPKIPLFWSNAVTATVTR